MPIFPADSAGGPMTWTRLDDGWTDQEVFDGLPPDARWHYLCLIQLCSRTSRYHGFVPKSRARRCSDVDDPDMSLAIIAGAGLITEEADGFTLPRIDEHVPPVHMRDEGRKERQRTAKQRSRLHSKGDHSACLPDGCPRAVSSESDSCSSPSSPVPSRPVPGVTSDVTDDSPMTESEWWADQWDREDTVSSDN